MSSASLSFYALVVLWINLIIAALPVRVRSTYVELLIGAIISGSGHITDALFAVGHQKHFSTYYWLVGKAKWSWIVVAKQLIRLVTSCFPRNEWNLIVDDFVCPRASKKAPEVRFHHEHCKKPNRPRFTWGQQWVALGVSLTWGKMSVSLPAMLRLHKSVGNGTKITTALTLVRSVLSCFKSSKDTVIRCLVDAWYMKGTFVLPLRKRSIHVIGQVRKDTALFHQPKPKKQKTKGRPRKYGNKLTSKSVARLPKRMAQLTIYGGCKDVTYRSTRCLARFLKGVPVIAVWCLLPNAKNWTLILSTDLTLTSEQIIKLYARRWKIEPMFNEIKNGCGVASAWEQTSACLHRWVSILCVAYTLTRMLSVMADSTKNKSSVPVIQWRRDNPVTAGLVRVGLQFFFRHFSFSTLWNQKSKKLQVQKQKNP